jgi:hypothetical protein
MSLRVPICWINRSQTACALLLAFFASLPSTPIGFTTDRRMPGIPNAAQPSWRGRHCAGAPRALLVETAAAVIDIPDLCRRAGMADPSGTGEPADLRDDVVRRHPGCFSRCRWRQ